ncbi:ParB N-terminal domain-containing protein [Psychroflexus aestuariivivens]|uniref:ParB N-terminal domain-containing protein n=1 Tax=Psychroflexus aestuariivivens TaxID=1795040 RepID=UPI000FD9A730|nr:ParB N-terminal domain-containing protein [Psychroflexus aestuariivivens]
MSKGKNPVTHVKLSIKDIIFQDENPRYINDEDLQKLAEDIKKDESFLMQRPPLINDIGGDFYCYAGTQRIKAAKLNGYNEIYCFVEKDVPEKVQRERMLKDNLHRGKWDKDKLLDLDFELMELKDFGFEDIDLDFIKDEPEFPDEFEQEKNENPPKMSITFVDSKQLSDFEKLIKDEVLSKQKFESITYSVSEGEL